jgi:hypothetical protein
MALLPNTNAENRELSATLACIRLLHLHEQVEAEQELLERAERRIIAALLEGRASDMEALEYEGQEAKIRVRSLQGALAFAAGEYRMLNRARLEARARSQ